MNGRLVSVRNLTRAHTREGQSIGEREMDRRWTSDPANLPIVLTDNPHHRMSPDRTERSWGWFPSSLNQKVHVGELRQCMQDLREGAAGSADRRTELGRLLRDGRRIASRLAELTHERGGRSSAIDSLSTIFQEDHLGFPRAFDNVRPWTRPRRQSW